MALCEQLCAIFGITYRYWVEHDITDHVTVYHHYPAKIDDASANNRFEIIK